MRDYIDRKALKEHLMSYAGMFTDELGFAVSLEAVLRGIDFQPAADVAEVVRCRDCKFYNNHAMRDVVFDVDACHWNADEQPDPDDFCSAGERKDDA